MDWWGVALQESRESAAMHPARCALGRQRMAEDRNGQIKRPQCSEEVLQEGYDALPPWQGLEQQGQPRQSIHRHEVLRRTDRGLQAIPGKN